MRGDWRFRKLALALFVVVGAIVLSLDGCVQLAVVRKTTCLDPGLLLAIEVFAALFFAAAGVLWLLSLPTHPRRTTDDPDG